jgi:hypothetical protein
MRDPIRRIIAGMRVELDLQHAVPLLKTPAESKDARGRALLCCSARSVARDTENNSLQAPLLRQ